MKRTLLALALLLVPAAALAAQAKPVPSPAALASVQELPAMPAPARQEDGTYVVRLPLSSLSPVRNTTLVNANDTFTFTIPVPERWEVRGAALTFGYVNSSALLPKLSRLTVRLGNKVIGQIELRPESPKGRVELPIPGELLPPGYNECAFVASLVSTQEYCESPNNPSLWTTLELESATVEIRYALKPVPPRLSAISGFLFDKRLFLGEDVTIVLPEFTEPALRLAAIAASGVALRLDYQAARARVSSRIEPGRDNLVIGEAEFVRKLLGQRAPAIGQSTLAVLPGEGSDSSGTAVIVLSGTGDGVEKAVKAFSALSFPFPDTPQADLSQVTDPSTRFLELARNVSRDKEYTFRSLGLFTKTLRTEWGKTASVELPFTFPSGLELSPNSYVALSLHMTYAPGMRQDSMLSVFVNDIFVGGVNFDDVKGGTYLDYRINLPLFVMRKGINTLALRPVLTPLKTAQCEYLQTGNLMVTLFDDSTLTFPDIPQWVKLPDLGLFYLDGFPYARRADLPGATLLVAGADQDTLSAAVNVAAQLSQRTGLPPYALAVRFGEKATGDVIAVGAVNSLPRALVEPAPFSLLPSGGRPYPQMPRPRPQEDEAAAHKAPLWSKYLPFLWESKRKHMEISQYLWTDVRSDAGVLPGKGFLTQYRTPGTEADTVTLVTGATPSDVAGLAVRLWEPAVRSRINGDLAMVDLETTKPEVTTLQVGESYYIGKIGTFPKLTLLVNTYPWTALGVVMGALALFAWGALKALRGIRASRK